MSRDKQTEIEKFSIDLQNVSEKASKIIMEEAHEFVSQNHRYNSLKDFHEAHPKGRFQMEAEFLAELGYRKSTDVAEEIFAEIDDFQRTLRHIFLSMCGGNDYNTLNLLQIDSAIEALFDSKIDELKKKYTESEDTE